MRTEYLNHLLKAYKSENKKSKILKVKKSLLKLEKDIKGKRNKI